MKKVLLFFAVLWITTAALHAQSYAESDKAALRNFLRQPSATAGKLNLEQLGLAVADTADWQNSETWVGKIIDITWISNTPRRVILIGYNMEWSRKQLAGNLNLTGCDSLMYLGCFNNQLTALDVTQNTVLSILHCFSNQFTSLDVTKNTALIDLICSNNELTSLDVTKNTELKRLFCSNNQLTALDVTKNTALTNLDCSNNALPLVDLKKASDKISDVNNKYLGTQQPVFFSNTAIYPNSTLDFSSQSSFGNPAANTVFTVKKGGSSAADTDYTISDGIITFKTKGTYTVEMTNDSIISNSSYPTIAITGTIEVVDTIYTVTASVNGSGGSISPSGNVKVAKNENKTFTIKPNTGYQIDQVLIDDINNSEAVAAGTYTFSNITANHSITVSFKQKQYTLTASGGANGTISPMGDSLVNYGSSVTYTLTPNTGYQIDQVLIDGTNYSEAVNAETYTFRNVTANHSIVVSFKQKQYTLTASGGANGTISPVGDSLVNYGSSVTYTITPNTGYQIDQVLIDDINNSEAVAAGTYTFSNIMADHSIVVVFKVVTGITEVEAQKATLKVYPNPVINGMLTVEISEGLLHSVRNGGWNIRNDRKIEIYTITGTLVGTYKVTGEEMVIDISHLASGMYTLQAGKERVKFIKK